MASYSALTVVSGNTISATWGNNVRDSAISVHASAAARDSAIASPTEGMVVYLSDSDSLTYYDGSAWKTAALAGAWTDYASSLTLTAVTTNPTKGNSTYAAEYAQYGKTTIYTFKITIGSTFVAGSGSYRFSLPVNADAGLRGVGSVWINDSGTGLRVGVITLVSATTAEIYISNITGGPISDTGPGTAWATGDVISATLTYEAA